MLSGAVPPQVAALRLGSLSFPAVDGRFLIVLKKAPARGNRWKLYDKDGRRVRDGMPFPMPR